MEETKQVLEKGEGNFDVDPSSLIDYEKLAELISDENFLKQFMGLISASNKKEDNEIGENTGSQTDMTPPDLEDILESL